MIIYYLFIASKYSPRNLREIFLVPISKADRIETNNKEIRQVFRPLFPFITVAMDYLEARPT